MKFKDSVKVFLRGGLGNQLFQYSFGYYLSKRFDKTLILREDLLPTCPDKVGGVSRWPNQISTFNFVGILQPGSHQPAGGINLTNRWKALQRLIGDLAPNFMWDLGIVASETKNVFPPSIKLQRVGEINSYASTLKFLMEYREDLSAQIEQIKIPSENYLQLLKEIKKDNPIAIHIRLGDYMDLERIYGSFSANYLQSSLDKLGSDSSPVWIFTQNRQEVSPSLLRIIGPSKIIDESSLSRPIENLVLLSKFEKIICSNSSFSWWAAILGSDQKKVSFPHYSHRHNVFSSELILPDWFKISLTD